MIRDLSLIGNIQVAMIGIVLVVGLFYIWRSICRMEEKMEKVNLTVQTMSKKLADKPTVCGIPSGGSFENDPIADAFMKQVFGQDDDDKQFVMFSSSPQEANGVRVEEVEVEAEAEHEKQDDESETDHTNPLSRSKLKKMNLDTLKALLLIQDFELQKFIIND